MQYAKLIDGVLQYAPNPIRVDGEDVFTTDPRPYGYKPVVYPEPPEQEGMLPVFDGWEETETEIRQKWKLVPEPEPVAERRIDKGEYFTVDGSTYQAATTIPAGDAIRPGTNCQLVTLEDALNAQN